MQVGRTEVFMRSKWLLISAAASLCLVVLAGTARPISAAGTCPDFDHNGHVDVQDVTALAGRWPAMSSDPRFDRDGDGVITVTDIQQVAARWQEACTPLSTCPFFPSDNIWNTRVDTLPLDSQSQAYIATIGANTGVHADFGAGEWDGGPIGIPFTTAPGSQPLVPITFIWYPDQSDPGPYPIPPDAPIEGGPDSSGDRHVLVVERDNCRLYELYYAWPQSGNQWEAGSGAVFDLLAHNLRPATWTSADAAGLPILPGLVTYDEVARGAITHALRFTVHDTRRAYVWPARHFASDSTNPAHPPMGQRFRLKAGFDISPFSAANRVILTALKRYGMMIADNGSNWFLSGAPDPRWDDEDLHQLQIRVHGSDFEAVDVSTLMVNPDSGRALPPPP
jgi:hypothetical protein